MAQKQKQIQYLFQFRGNKKLLLLKSHEKIVVLVDDGIATAAITIAASRWLRENMTTNIWLLLFQRYPNHQILSVSWSELQIN
jgi:predicted phosphoribosyltransferase